MTTQALAALDRANEIRLARAQLKRQLKDGSLTLSEALDEPSMQSMTLFKLLRCIPRWGHKRSINFCARIPISPYRKISELTERQRAALVEGLG